jgi:hypothetical protein
LTAEIQRIKPDIKVIFMSGHTRDVFGEKGIKDEKFNFLQEQLFCPKRCSRRYGKC